jgi:hypothetical protein
MWSEQELIQKGISKPDMFLQGVSNWLANPQNIWREALQRKPCGGGKDLGIRTQPA